MKEGLYTTEFWGKTILQTLSLILAILVMGDIVSVGDGDAILTTLSVAIPAVLEAAYALSRAITKAGEAPSEGASAATFELIMEQIKTGTLTAALQKAFADLDFANTMNQRLQAQENEKHESRGKV